VWFGKSASGNGYGQFWMSGKPYAAHRVSYELHVGPIRMVSNWTTFAGIDGASILRTWNR
jgi:hypothetical protein